MKTLYFIGNEELWNDAWFKALVESLEKKINLSLLVYDSVKDFSKIKAISNQFTIADRVIFKKGISFDLGLEKKHQQLVYIFSKEEEDLSKNSCIKWGVSEEAFLEKIGISESSQVIEEDFLSEINIASEVSKVIESEKKSSLDNEAFNSSPEDLAKLLETEFSAPLEESSSEELKKDSEDISLSFDSSLVEIKETPGNELESSLENNLNEEGISNQNKNSELDSQDLLAALEGSPKQELKKDSLDIGLSLDSSLIEIKETPGNELESSLENNLNEEGISNQNKNSELDSQDLLTALEGSSSLRKEKALEEKNDILAKDTVSIDNIKPEIEVGKLLSSMSSEVSSEDLDVIKRYSNIKERELRESQASAEALRRQIRYFDERLKKSEEERRKLFLKIEELQSELRTTSDKKEENRAQLKNIEKHYEEKIKELQIQLESSQFQAGKLEKKLEDFRDRVRNDLQKIRSRERELASRLEIQKRDAEALLSAKDERLLNQKRDVDRLEFEIDKLRERLIDDVNRSEERRKRIARALQSLKLAQSVLSGLDEESLEKDDRSKAA